MPALAQELGLWLLSGADDTPDAEPVLCRPVLWWPAWWQPNDDGTWSYQRDATDDELRKMGQLAS